MTKRLIDRKTARTPNKLFIASAYRIEDEWGVRFETVFSQTSSHEVGSRGEALKEIETLINAVKTAYLASSGNE